MRSSFRANGERERAAPARTARSPPPRARGARRPLPSRAPSARAAPYRCARTVGEGGRQRASENPPDHAAGDGARDRLRSRDDAELPAARPRHVRRCQSASASRRIAAAARMTKASRRAPACPPITRTRRLARVPSSRAAASSSTGATRSAFGDSLFSAERPLVTAPGEAVDVPGLDAVGGERRDPRVRAVERLERGQLRDSRESFCEDEGRLALEPKRLADSRPSHRPAAQTGSAKQDALRRRLRA